MRVSSSIPVLTTVLLVTSVLILPLVTADIPKEPIPKEYDCPIRTAAYEYGTNVVINTTTAKQHPKWDQWAQIMYDGLDLSGCDVPPPKSSAARRGMHTPVRPLASPTDIIVYVGPDGDDSLGDGSASHPYKTLPRALVSAPSRVPSPSTVLRVRLFPGTFQLLQPVTVSQDWVSIEAADPSKPPVLTGAAQFSGLQWSKSPIGPGVMMAKLPASALFTDGSAASGGGGLTLTVDGVPYTLARWPNANPIYDRFPVNFSPNSIEQLKTRVPAPPYLQQVVASPSDPGSHFPQYSHRMVDPSKWHQGGGKGGVVFAPSNFSSRVSSWSNPTTGLAFHWDGHEVTAPAGFTYMDQWMTYTYAIDSVETSDSNVTLNFGRGGWQGLNGDSAYPHAKAYVMNIKEELDNPGEFFIETVSDGSYLVHLFPNATAGQPTVNGSSVLGISQGQTVLRVMGTPEVPVVGVSLSHVYVTGTQPTQMEKYWSPSSNIAGWSVARRAAVEVTGAVGFSVSGSTFDFVGGNAVLLLGHVKNASISGTVFTRCGDSGIVSAGVVHGIDGASVTTFVEGTVVDGILGYLMGWYGQQISLYTQFASSHATVQNVAAFDFPRSVLNFNDGGFGGWTVERVVGWRAVLASADHGFFNSWAREPIAFVHPTTGNVQLQPDIGVVRKTFLIAAGGTLSNVDPDDGSFRQLHENNVFVGAGRKNYLGREKVDTQNLFLFPDLGDMRTACYFSDGPVAAGPEGWGEVFSDNTCVLASKNQIAEQGECSLKNITGTTTAANSNLYYLAEGAGEPVWQCHSTNLNFSTVQAAGWEHNSTVKVGLPSVDDVKKMIAETLA